MGRDALSKLFGAVGAFVSLYALSAAILLQGGTALSTVPGLDARSPVQSFYVATIVVGWALVLASAIAIAHVRLPIPSNSTGWAFPIVWLGDVEFDQPKAWSSRLYVGFLVVVVFILPALSLFHFNSVMNQNGRVWNEELPGAASAEVACAFPFWPFGNCDPSQMSRYLAYAAVTRLEKGKPTRPGRLWLSGNACDFIAWREMTGPQLMLRRKDGGVEILPEEMLSRGRVNELEASLAVELISKFEDLDIKVRDNYCAGPNLRSELCKADVSKCRGVEWTNVSPFLVIGSTVFAWLSVVAFFVVWFRHERTNRVPQMAPSRTKSGANIRKKRR